MSGSGFALHLATALLVGAAVNWLADWLPGVGGQEDRQPVVSGWRRRSAVFLTCALFGGYLSLGKGSAVSSALAKGWIIWLLFALFLLILVIDLEHRRVLNVVIYPMNGAALALALLRPDLSLISAVVGGVVGFGVFFVLFLLRPGGLGAGDVKLAGLIGLLVGFPGVLVSLLGAIVLGGIAAAFLLLFRRVRLRGTMAYAPYLSIGAMIALLYGPAIVAWYLGRLGML